VNGDNGKHPHQEFKIQAADEKGHTERVQIRMPPQMLSKMQKAVNSKIWPYENYQELARHAILQHLKWLERDEPQVGNMSYQIDAMNVSMNEELEFQAMDQMYQKMQSVFKKNLALGGDIAHSRNLKLVSEIWRKICAIDDAYWRALWKDKFRKEYDTVLSSVPDMGLGELEEGDPEWD
jgi:Arc/MetJ-type ribon-helix-helix transcriptional regulator